MNLLIKPTELYDLDSLAYRNDTNSWMNLGDSKLFSKEETEAWLRKLPRSKLRFSIFSKLGNKVGFNATDQLIEKDNLKRKIKGEGLSVINYHHIPHSWDFAGIVRVDNIDDTNRNCYVGIDIVEEFRGLGFARASYKWLLTYLFNHRNMNAIYAEVLSYNEISSGLLRTLGFSDTGFFPQKVFRDGKYWDYLLLSLTRDKFQEREEKLKMDDSPF